MHVIATAGHVDHGKSTLVRALTGTDPDRLEEEHRRGLTIELGYAWTTLPPVGEVAFVDVPGHERFLSTMLSGVGPVPAVLFVVAADDPWMPQAAEHLAALDALGVARGVLAVTRADLADPAPAMARALAEMEGTSLRGVPAVAVSGHTGQGLDLLRALLVDLVASLPTPDPEAPVRLWLDRSFHIKGAGTVVTGTLNAGRVRVGDRLQLGATGRAARADHAGADMGGAPGDGQRMVRIRSVQSLGRTRTEVSGVARVALNLAGMEPGDLDRSSVLVTQGSWLFTRVVDVRLGGAPTSDVPPLLPSSNGDLPQRAVLHIGATSVSVHVRPLGSGLARLSLERHLPLRIGDRALVRDPGSRALWGMVVLDPSPPALGRRGAAMRRATELAEATGDPDLEAEVARRGLTRASFLRRLGVGVESAAAAPVTGSGVLRVGDWLISDARASALRLQLARVVREQHAAAPLEPGVPLTALAAALAVPDPTIVAALVEPPLRVEGGRVAARPATQLPAEAEHALEALTAELEDQPFMAPTADRLRELRLDTRTVAAAAKLGRLLRLDDGIVLAAGADRLAVERLRELPSPFTLSEARMRLNSTRRVMLPLLAHLDRQRWTRRLPDDRRVVTGPLGDTEAG